MSIENRQVARRLAARLITTVTVFITGLAVQICLQQKPLLTLDRHVWYESFSFCGSSQRLGCQRKTPVVESVARLLSYFDCLHPLCLVE
jgi:hypothetical protein